MKKNDEVEWTDGSGGKYVGVITQLIDTCFVGTLLDLDLTTKFITENINLEENVIFQDNNLAQQLDATNQGFPFQYMLSKAQIRQDSVSPTYYRALPDNQDISFLVTQRIEDCGYIIQVFFSTGAQYAVGSSAAISSAERTLKEIPKMGQMKRRRETTPSEGEKEEEEEPPQKVAVTGMTEGEKFAIEYRKELEKTYRRRNMKQKLKDDYETEEKRREANEALGWNVFKEVVYYEKAAGKGGRRKERTSFPKDWSVDKTLNAILRPPPQVVRYEPERKEEKEEEEEKDPLAGIPPEDRFLYEDDDDDDSVEMIDPGKEKEEELIQNVITLKVDAKRLKDILTALETFVSGSGSAFYSVYFEFHRVQDDLDYAKIWAMDPFTKNTFSIDLIEDSDLVDQLTILTQDEVVPVDIRNTLAIFMQELSANLGKDAVATLSMDVVESTRVMRLKVGTQSVQFKIGPKKEIFQEPQMDADVLVSLPSSAFRALVDSKRGGLDDQVLFQTIAKPRQFLVDGNAIEVTNINRYTKDDTAYQITLRWLRKTVSAAVNRLSKYAHLKFERDATHMMIEYRLPFSSNTYLKYSIAPDVPEGEDEEKARKEQEKRKKKEENDEDDPQPTPVGGDQDAVTLKMNAKIFKDLIMTLDTWDAGVAGNDLFLAFHRDENFARIYGLSYEQVMLVEFRANSALIDQLDIRTQDDVSQMRLVVGNFLPLLKGNLKASDVVTLTIDATETFLSLQVTGREKAQWRADWVQTRFVDPPGDAVSRVKLTTSAFRKLVNKLKDEAEKRSDTDPLWWDRAAEFKTQRAPARFLVNDTVVQGANVDTRQDTLHDVGILYLARSVPASVGRLSSKVTLRFGSTPDAPMRIEYVFKADPRTVLRHFIAPKVDVDEEEDEEKARKEQEKRKKKEENDEDDPLADIPEEDRFLYEDDEDDEIILIPRKKKKSSQKEEGEKALYYLQRILDLVHPDGRFLLSDGAERELVAFINKTVAGFGQGSLSTIQQRVASYVPKRWIGHVVGEGNRAVNRDGSKLEIPLEIISRATPIDDRATLLFLTGAIEYIIADVLYVAGLKIENTKRADRTLSQQDISDATNVFFIENQEAIPREYTEMPWMPSPPPQKKQPSARDAVIARVKADLNANKIAVIRARYLTEEKRRNENRKLGWTVFKENIKGAGVVKGELKKSWTKANLIAFIMNDPENVVPIQAEPEPEEEESSGEDLIVVPRKKKKKREKVILPQRAAGTWLNQMRAKYVNASPTPQNLNEIRDIVDAKVLKIIFNRMPNSVIDALAIPRERWPTVLRQSFQGRSQFDVEFAEFTLHLLSAAHPNRIVNYVQGIVISGGRTPTPIDMSALYQDVIAYVMRQREQSPNPNPLVTKFGGRTIYDIIKDIADMLELPFEASVPELPSAKQMEEEEAFYEIYEEGDLLERWRNMASSMLARGTGLLQQYDSFAAMVRSMTQKEIFEAFGDDDKRYESGYPLIFFSDDLYEKPIRKSWAKAKMLEALLRPRQAIEAWENRESREAIEKVVKKELVQFLILAIRENVPVLANADIGNYVKDDSAAEDKVFNLFYEPLVVDLWKFLKNRQIYGRFVPNLDGATLYARIYYYLNDARKQIAEGTELYFADEGIAPILDQIDDSQIRQLLMVIVEKISTIPVSLAISLSMFAGMIPNAKLSDYDFIHYLNIEMLGRMISAFGDGRAERRDAVHAALIYLFLFRADRGFPDLRLSFELPPSEGTRYWRGIFDFRKLVKTADGQSPFRFTFKDDQPVTAFDRVLMRAANLFASVVIGDRFFSNAIGFIYLSQAGDNRKTTTEDIFSRVAQRVIDLTRDGTYFTGLPLHKILDVVNRCARDIRKERASDDFFQRLRREGAPKFSKEAIVSKTVTEWAVTQNLSIGALRQVETAIVSMVDYDPDMLVNSDLLTYAIGTQYEDLAVLLSQNVRTIEGTRTREESAQEKQSEKEEEESSGEELVIPRKKKKKKAPKKNPYFAQLIKLKGKNDVWRINQETGNLEVYTSSFNRRGWTPYELDFDDSLDELQVRVAELPTPPNKWARTSEMPEPEDPIMRVTFKEVKSIRKVFFEKNFREHWSTPLRLAREDAARKRREIDQSTDYYILDTATNTIRIKDAFRRDNPRMPALFYIRVIDVGADFDWSFDLKESRETPTFYHASMATKMYSVEREPIDTASLLPTINWNFFQDRFFKELNKWREAKEAYRPGKKTNEQKRAEGLRFITEEEYLDAIKEINAAFSLYEDLMSETRDQDTQPKNYNVAALKKARADYVALKEKYVWMADALQSTYDEESSILRELHYTFTDPTWGGTYNVVLGRIETIDEFLLAAQRAADPVLDIKLDVEKVLESLRIKSGYLKNERTDIEKLSTLSMTELRQRLLKNDKARSKAGAIKILADRRRRMVAHYEQDITALLHKLRRFIGKYMNIVEGDTDLAKEWVAAYYKYEKLLKKEREEEEEQSIGKQCDICYSIAKLSFKCSECSARFCSEGCGDEHLLDAH